jgi:hypothetical protein
MDNAEALAHRLVTARADQFDRDRNAARRHRAAIKRVTRTPELAGEVIAHLSHLASVAVIRGAGYRGACWRADLASLLEYPQHRRSVI